MTTLSLPEEFVLLLHKSNGSYYASSDHTGAAELGELVLTERVGLEDKKLTVLDAEPSGTAATPASTTPKPSPSEGCCAGSARSSC
ncbi:hypothetical protein R4I43_25515 [Saccharopolyspora sp. S2-29]|uniref:Uncharacterized protein n=1 Tax=Saccharopolyspora mangrovi TaxID=3082379 RepID=A0ABU6AGU7_9PSEU|nr:hypothetical protein [Saccharopolyspora sp. S2-29]